MSWLESWLLTVVIMGSHGCLKCSKEAMALRTNFRNSYLEQKLQKDPQLKTKLQQLLDNVIQQLSNQPVDPQKYMGIIDELTLKKLTVYFKRSLNQIKENNFEDQQLFNEMMWSLQKLVTYFEEVMPQVTKLYCSNDCGRMVYVFISCFSCETNQQSCTKNYHCGERKILVETDGDLVLDCALKWHKASYGVKTYKFYRMVYNKEELMASSTDSYLIKKEVNMKDAGRYRCKMMDIEGYAASQLEFQVVVLPTRQTTWFTRPPPLVPPPSLLSSASLLPIAVENPLTLGISSRAPTPTADWTAWKVSGITGGVLFFIVAVFLCYYRHMAKKEEEEDEDDDDGEEDEDESDSDSDSSELVEM
ncbi:izumo sperm-egg fusion protein 1 [Candoia aspera]|uniref:izumo sperm-egg fusion protein 1 n=1 Tax=Candoia aspera TaxID=51853 RepID=UPI002FD85E3E